MYILKFHRAISKFQAHLAFKQFKCSPTVNIMAENVPKKSVSTNGCMNCLLADNSSQFRSFIWDTDTHLKTKEERKLLRKLDFSILTIGCLGFFVCTVRQLVMTVAETCTVEIPGSRQSCKCLRQVLSKGEYETRTL